MFYPFKSLLFISFKAQNIYKVYTNILKIRTVNLFFQSLRFWTSDFPSLVSRKYPAKDKRDYKDETHLTASWTQELVWPLKASCRFLEKKWEKKIKIMLVTAEIKQGKIQ